LKSHELKPGMILKGENLNTTSGSFIWFLIFIKDVTKESVTSVQYVMSYTDGKPRLTHRRGDLTTVTVDGWDSEASIFHKTIPASWGFCKRFLTDVFKSD
jgi:hypothetical protein